EDDDGGHSEQFGARVFRRHLKSQPQALQEHQSIEELSDQEVATGIHTNPVESHDAYDSDALAKKIAQRIPSLGNQHDGEAQKRGKPEHAYDSIAARAFGVALTMNSGPFSVRYSTVSSTFDSHSKTRYLPMWVTYFPGKVMPGGGVITT